MVSVGVWIISGGVWGSLDVCYFNPYIWTGSPATLLVAFLPVPYSRPESAKKPNQFFEGGRGFFGSERAGTFFEHLLWVH